LRRDLLFLRRHASLILAAVRRAADPFSLVRDDLRARPLAVPSGGRLVVVAIGKAAAMMAAAAESVLRSRIDAGVVVAQAPGAVPLRRLPLLITSHPLPDERGMRAAHHVEMLARGLEAKDVVLALLSGGSSALLPAPVPGITLDDKRALTDSLLRAGATINEMNIVRRHLSRLKGGGLARLMKAASVRGLLLSDVLGDDPAAIASGMLSPDPTTYADAVRVLRRHRIAPPPNVARHLAKGLAGEAPETPKPGDAAFRRVRIRLIGNNRIVVDAALREARLRGLRARVVERKLHGEAAAAGVRLANLLRRESAGLRPGGRALCLIAGGEVTVTRRGHGRGGRNLELAVAAAKPLAAMVVPALLASLATDGLDGNSDAAGAFADSQTLARAAQAGLRAPESYLATNDTATFLEPIGGLIRTEPTGTNLLDVTLLLAGYAR
jgi:glycerate 2-kinase